MLAINYITIAVFCSCMLLIFKFNAVQGVPVVTEAKMSSGCEKQCSSLSEKIGNSWSDCTRCLAGEKMFVKIIIQLCSDKKWGNGYR